MKLPEQKGIRKLINTYTESHNEVDMPAYQKLMRRVNNCKATSWKCSYCSGVKLKQCQKRVRDYIQMEVYKKYKDDPAYRKMVADGQKNKLK